MRLRSATIHDIRFQYRHGFYYAYLFVSVLYILMLRVIPEGFRQTAAILIIFSDPAVLGFFFIGGIVLLEKGMHIMESLFITPLRIKEYLLSKLISLTMIAIMVSYLILVLTFGIQFNPVSIFFGVLLSSVFFTLLGFTLAVRTRSINQYLIISPFVMIIFILPVLEFLGLMKTPLFYLLPGKASLILLKAGFEVVPLGEFIASILIMVIWILVVYQWASRWFYQYIILKIGGGR